MSAQPEWITSPAFASNSLERPHWEMSRRAKLLTRPSRHATNQRTGNCDQMLWPVEHNIKQTMRPLDRTTRPTRQSPQPQQPLQPPEHTQTQQSQLRQPASQRSQPPQLRSSPLPQENLKTTRWPSKPFQQQRRRPHERANERGNNVELVLGPPRFVSKCRPDGVQECRQSRRRPQQFSHQRVRQSQQAVHHNFDGPLQPSNFVPNHQASSASRQQNPRSAQQVSASVPPPPPRRRSDQPASGDSKSSSESYIELSPARRREVIRSVNESVQHVMASMLSDNASNVQWKPKHRKKDMTYYMDETTVKPGQTRFCCVSHTHAMVDEIMKLFVVSDAESMARNIRILSDSLMETQVLSVLRWPTKQQPMNSMYVQYMCYRSPGLMEDREVCIAVATDMIHQPDGSTIGYCLWDTVDGPEFAEATNKLEPCIMFRSGFFLRRTGRRRRSTIDCPNQSYTKIVYMTGIESGGWAPAFTTRLLMEKFGTTLTRLCSYFRRKKLDSRTFVMKNQWIPKMSVKSCNECEKQLQVLSNRVNCHACGHVVCRSCVSKELVELHAVGFVPMYICFSCLEKTGLSAHTSSQTRSSLGRRRLPYDTTNVLRIPTRQPLLQPQPYRQSSLVDEEDEEDSDNGEWAFTPSGVPVRPYRMAL